MEPNRKRLFRRVTALIRIHKGITEMVRILKKHIAGEDSIERRFGNCGVETRCDSPSGNSSRSSATLSN